VVYDDDTPAAVIEALRPSVLVKGADWAKDAIVGAEVVTRDGGEVVRVPLVDGKSTTSLVGRIRRP
jgi:D-beta-D-heptose 7-phosphate kinase/D-beta-D-heptose 1-phosphate adenosyltransferase